MKKCCVIIFFLVLILVPTFRVNAESGEYIIKLKNDFPIEIYKSELKEINKDKRIYVTKNENLLNELSEYVETVEANERVDLIEGFETISLYSTPSDELYFKMWQLDMINISSAWNLETYGNEIKVAVIDTGCYAHEDLKNNLLDGKNYFDKSSDVSDNIGHGTHVSGIIAAQMDELGVVGVAPKSKIVPLKCFDTSKTTDVDMIVSAIYDAVDVYKCQVINMSWGLKSNNPFLEEAIKYAYDNGVILVAAVGNSYSDTLYYPAAYDCVVGVGSVTSSKDKSDFSQRNESVFVVAPGSDILSTYNDGGYKKLNGTSQATPIVSGLATILLSIDDNNTINDFKRLLSSTTEDLGAQGYDTEFGYGLINVGSFIKKALKDMSVYISPSCNKDGKEGVYYFNLTDDKQALSCVSAYYDGFKMERYDFNNITLLTDTPFFFENKDLTKNIKYMVWENFNSLVPIGKLRELKR